MPANDDQRAQINEILEAPSQYPEFARKSREQREADLLAWLENYDEVNVCYNLYGMDRADAQPCDDWLDLKTFSKTRWDVNSSFSPLGKSLKYDHTLIPRHKLLSEMFLSHWFGEESDAYVPSRAVFNWGNFLMEGSGGTRRMEPATFAEFIARYDTGQRLVFKEVFGGRGRQVIISQIEGGKISVDGELLELDAFVEKFISPASTWIVQEYLEQHPDMARFNPSSLNTLRIVTYHVGTHALVDGVAVRMGHPGALVDNAYANGYYTSVDDDGRLDESLFNFSSKSRTIHEFQDAIIPSIQAARDLCIEAHSLLPELFTIGWDIAIDAQGNPTVVECNDGWAVFVNQTSWGHAGRPAWNRNLAERRAYFDSIE